MDITGKKVKVNYLDVTRGMMINSKHLSVRKIGITGTIAGYVPGHGGDVWWVKHDESDEIGTYYYCESGDAEFNELEILD